MNFAIDKDIVGKRFTRSILSYNNEALVQRKIAKELVLGIKNHMRTPYDRVLEIGCGTGFLSHEFLQSFHPEEYVLNDLSAPMQKEIEKIALAHRLSNWMFLAGDAEKITFPGEFNLVLSASVFQWFHNIKHFLSSANRLVKKGGMLAFSTFGPDNFKEIKILQASGLNYPSINDVIHWLSSYFQIIDSSEDIVPLYFASPFDVLKHIKLTGVNGIETTRWSRQKLTDFCTKYYQNCSTPTLTYHPIIIIARKK